MRLLTGYAKPIAALAALPDGSRLYSVARNQKRIWLWDATPGEVVARWRRDGLGTDIGSLAASPAGDYVLSATKDGGVDLWPADGSPRRHLGFRTRGAPSCVVHHPRLSLAAVVVRTSVGSTHAVAVFDPLDPTGTARRFEADNYVHSVALSPDGTRVAWATSGGFVTLTDIRTGGRLGRVPAQSSAHVSFHPTADVFAIASGRSLFVANGSTADTGDELQGHDAVIRVVVYSPDGKYLATAGDDGIVLLRDASTLELRGRRHPDIGKISALCWRGDSTGLFAGGAKLIADCDLADLLGTDRVRTRGGDPLSLSGHNGRVTHLAYSADGRSLVSCDIYAGVRGWDLSGLAGQARQAFSFALEGYSGVRAASWSPDGSAFALAQGDDGSIHDGATGEQLHRLAEASMPNLGLHYLATGELFVRQAAQNSATLEIRDGDGVAVLRTTRVNAPGSLPAHLPSLAASPPAGTPVYFALGQTLVMRWDRLSGEATPLFTQGTIIAAMGLSPDGRHVVTAGAKSAYVWDAATAQEVLKLPHPLTCTGVTFTPDGRLATACYDGVVRLFDVATGAELYAFDLAMGRVYSLAVAPDGMTFAAGVHKHNAVVLMDVPE